MITFISVPRKGRNAGWALKDVLGGDNFFDPEFIAGFLNGTAKEQAKKSSWTREFEQEFNRQGWQEITRKADTGRKSRRAVLDEIKIPGSGRELKISGGLPEEEILNSSEPDEVYVADDQAANNLLQEREASYSPESQGLKAFLQENFSGYRPLEEVGDTVSLSVMWSKNSNPEEISTVMLPEDLYTLSERIADSYWDQELEKASYREFADSNGFSGGWDEEELISEAGEDVGGVYITNSGGTADKYDLDYEEVVDSTVRRWVETGKNTRGVSA